ncbi:hypothetical protein [Halomonas elongata]|uniref:Uncharacterized protein n=1 Tax=Halomonas elongata (strain ATCC 33173 / DSM 2581 / NBRC 15536 / NCIMB 2198 / 1H9) TaxID=768066 RepID=E1VBZ2_HALED|nr:hypothetical protein [Halomonas elongata]MBW5798965.1 hypothetical protein [Halomonas elongata]WBF19535.1 hypothetical protein LM502_07560 [Halomonas elongata]WPU48398.1 hypothetical protein SR933_05785 [Halomonas elongata DSM 2581]CBV42262.1 uncharacterized protein HELO_2378 [Halomonas elongata DSM 2581]
MSDEHQLESRLLGTGVERLALLGKHAEALMQGYSRDEIPLEALSDTALRRLLAARIVWRPDEQGGVKLAPKVRELIAEMLADETRRQVNADVGETLELLRSLVQSYREAMSQGEHWRQEQLLLRLRQVVDDLNGRFADAIDSLWQRLNSDFGFVSRLNDKIRENDRAQKQIVRLLDGLALIDFDELIELVGSDGALRKLLISQLQRQLSQHYTSLREVQSRLTELMARFRQQQSRSRLVSGMAAFLREHPNFVPGNYARRSEVPELVNRATPLSAAAAPALDHEPDTRVLTELVHQLPTPVHKPQEVAAARPAEVAEQSLVAARQQALKQDVESFYLKVIDHPDAAGISALAYLEESDLEWGEEIWLFQVIAEYQGLPRSEQRAFRLHQTESRASRFNDLRLIHDVTLQLATA